jgi:hypothetical protein
MFSKHYIIKLKKVVDSFGKPSSGILQGNFQWNGEFDECRSSFNETYDWYPKYCKLNMV